MSIKNITDKILNDAKEKAAEILANSSKEAAALVSCKVSEAASQEAYLISKAKEEAEARKNRIIQNAELTARNEKLVAKHQIIEKTFNYSLESLEKLSDSDFVNFVKSTLKSYKISGDGFLKVNKARYNVITPEVLRDINAFAETNFVLGRSIDKDGFIVEQKGIQINCTFEALVESLKEDLIFDVTKILFE
jgi:V/A-type H+/Na+-transporting ATPase subunit E